MKQTKWIVCAFLSIIFITPLILHAAQDNGVAHRVAALEAAVESLTTALETANSEIANLQSELATANTAITNLQTELADVQNNSVLALDQILTIGIDESGYPRALFNGVNVQIVNGLGATNGYPDAPATDDSALTQVNGLGNLFIGYNEGPPGGWPPQSREGSHNVVMGRYNSFSSFGGMVNGRHNNIAGPYANVIGGHSSKATDGIILDGSVSRANGGAIISGFYNETHGSDSVIIASKESGAQGGIVIGGINNGAGGAGVVISGSKNGANGFGVVISGEHNQADGYAVVTSGLDNHASGYSSVSAGEGNRASHSSSVSGGRFNNASGNWSSILGGEHQTTTTDYETIPAIP